MLVNVLSAALRHKLLVFVAGLGIVVAGVLALRDLPIDAFPDISPNLVQIFAEIEGMAPEEVEQLVTRPVEAAMRSTPGVKKIRSLSSLGLSTVNVYFHDDVDIYRARQLVAERLKLAEEGIPEGVHMPHGLEIGPVASGMGKILHYYLDGGDLDIAELRTMQDWIVKRELETVPGVAKVVSQGGYVQEYQVALDPRQLLGYRLTMDDVAQALRHNNANIGAGIVPRGSEELIVRSLGRLRGTEDIEQVVVGTRNARPVLVKDVARVEFGKAFRRGVGYLDGERELVCGGIYKVHQANSFAVIRRLKARIEEINESLPNGVKLVTFYDQSELVRNSIGTIRQALLLGLVLVCLVAFVFLGNLRNALITVGSLPFSMLFAFMLMRLNGIPGDLISFGGVAIALGMIIDATIIMVEKIQTLSKDRADATDVRGSVLAAAGEVGRPILFAVAIIIIVFLPIFTLGEVEGKMFRPLAFTVATTMAGSLVYALLIAPVLYLGLHPRAAKPPRQERGRGVLPWVLDGYEAVLRRVVRHPLVVVGALLLLLVSGGYTFLRLGREFIPTLREGTIQCMAHMSPNIGLEEITQTCSGIAEELKSFPEVRHVIADIGYGEVGPHVHHTNFGCLTVTLTPQDTWRTAKTQEGLVAAMSERLEDVLGASIAFSQPINHELDGLVAGVGAAVAVKIFGHNIDVLKWVASEVEQVLDTVDGVADLRTERIAGQSQLQVELDSASLARHGLSKDAVQAMLYRAVNGEELGHVFQAEKAFRILMRFADEYRNSIEAVGDLLIRTPAGAHVPLRELADIGTVTGIRQITREDTRRYLSVQCNVRGRDVGTFVADAQEAIEANVTLPPGYRIDWGGQFELQQAANRRLAIVVPLTLLLVVCLLYGLFNSAKDLLLILLNVPLALTGGLFALAYFGENVSIPSSVGFIALFGIALTDSVVLISRFLHLQREGHPLSQAVIAGCRSKFRPVLMTTLTTALGLLPLVMATGTGSEVQRPLAIVVVGGLLSSTLLTLLAIPTLYLWISRESAAQSGSIP